MTSRDGHDDAELSVTRAALARALHGTPAAEAAADALRAVPTFDGAARARVSRRVIGCAVLRIRLAYLARRDDVDGMLGVYLEVEEGGAAPPRAWPSDRFERLVVERGCPVPLARALVDSLGIEAADAFLAASNEPGPRTLRANVLKAGRDDVARALALEGIATRPGQLSPWALAVEGRANLFGAHAWRSGLFEVQDEGSQLVALATGARPGDVVVDLCAGRGGKTLALAAMMNDEGELWVSDIDRRALADMRPRLARASVRSVREGLPRDGADVTLVDAPCSSTGVLRRHPDLRHAFQRDDAARHAAVQSALLEHACALTRSGGTVVYATCSVLREENEAVIARAPSALAWQQQRMVRPDRDGCDGFFWAMARRA